MRLVSEGKRVTDLELRRRIKERSAAVQKQIFDEHGIVDWANDMIRDAREGIVAFRGIVGLWRLTGGWWGRPPRVEMKWVQFVWLRRGKFAKSLPVPVI